MIRTLNIGIVIIVISALFSCTTKTAFNNGDPVELASYFEAIDTIKVYEDETWPADNVYLCDFVISSQGELGTDAGGQELNFSFTLTAVNTPDSIDKITINETKLVENSGASHEVTSINVPVPGIVQPAPGQTQGMITYDLSKHPVGGFYRNGHIIFDITLTCRHKPDKHNARVKIKYQLRLGP